MPYSISEPGQLAKLLTQLKKPSYQSDITAVTISLNGAQYSFVRPKGYDTVSFVAEYIGNNGKVKGGERINCYADDSRISIMLHNGQKAARVTVVKMGRQQYSPMLDI
jgi:hypothetical protein